MNITHRTSPTSAATDGDTFEEVDVPAIQAEIQERKLENLPPENLFSPEVVQHGHDNGVVDTTVAASHAVAPGSRQPQVVETTPGRPRVARR